MADDRRVEQADAIRALRAELVRAQQEGEDESLRFRLGEVALEFEFAVEREAGADAGIRFWVISLGAKGGVSTARTHRVKLSLTPETDSGAPPYVAGTGGKDP